jgi:hypothetical protein
MRNAIGKLEFTVACKTIEDQGKTLVAFDVAGAFKEFIEHCADNNPG